MSALKIVVSLLGLALDVSGKRHASNRNSMSLSKESTTTASTTTYWFLSAEHENDLPDCLSIPTFPGKCQISQSPGACYSKEEDEVWQCWSDLQPQETMNDKTCKEVVQKDGACVFKEHFVKHSDDDLKSCWDVSGFNSQCPVTEMWGACYHKDLDQWQCIPKDSPIEVLKGYRDGDCKATPTAADSAVAYDDVCSFQDAEQAVYKCPGVPTYDEKIPHSSCLQENIAFACFSLREGVSWQCIGSDEKSVPSCMSTQIPIDEQVEKGEAYDGVCVHDTSDLYDSAKSGDDLTIRTTPTTITKATTTTAIAKTATTGTPTEITTTLGSGALKSQLSGVLFVVFFFCSQALLM